MVTIAEVVNVNVAVQSAPLSPASFGRPAIFAEHTVFAENFRLYTSTQGMLDDGFLATDQAFLEAQSLLAQSAISGRRVQDFIQAKRAAPVAQVERGTVTFAVGENITTTISGPNHAQITVVTATATDAPTTAGNHVTDLGNDATFAANYSAADNLDGTLDITASNDGVPFTVSGSATGAADLEYANQTPSVGLPEDLTTVVDDGAEFYACIPIDRDAGDIEAFSAAIEAHTPPKILLAQSSDANLLAAAHDPNDIHTDIGSELKGNNRNRTSLWYHSDDAEALAAAIAGYALPFNPGTITWALKELSGITADNLTDTQYTFLTGTPSAPTTGKNVNVYIPHGSQVSITQRGMMASGRFIDVQRTADWLANQVQTSVANLLLANEKIPLDDSGIALVEQAVLQPLQAAKEAGVLASDREISVSVPSSSDVSATDRAARQLNNVTASVVYSGAIHNAQVDITVQL